MEIRFHRPSFLIFIALFLIEVIIALFVKDSIIRPYGGDVLVVIMMYYFVKSFAHIRPLYLSLGVTLFAYIIEAAQYLHLVETLGVQHNKILRTVLGSSFSWGDMLAYTIGGIICYLIDTRKQ